MQRTPLHRDELRQGHWREGKEMVRVLLKDCVVKLGPGMMHEFFGNAADLREGRGGGECSY